MRKRAIILNKALQPVKRLPSETSLLESIARGTIVLSSRPKYSWLDCVLVLSDRLRVDGIDCHIDQCKESPADGWLRWRVNQIEDAAFVPVICTENDERRFSRFRAKGEQGKGLGIRPSQAYGLFHRLVGPKILSLQAIHATVQALVPDCCGEPLVQGTTTAYGYRNLVSLRHDGWHA